MNHEDEIRDEAEFGGDFDPENETIVRAKWAMDGAGTLSEAAAKLRAMADSLEWMEREGWQLTGPVTDDYGFARPRNEQAPETV